MDINVAFLHTQTKTRIIKHFNSEYTITGYVSYSLLPNQKSNSFATTIGSRYSHEGPWRHCVIPQTELDGLTGLIRFTETGHRRNFTLQLIEMTVNREMIKVTS